MWLHQKVTGARESPESATGVIISGLSIFNFQTPDITKLRFIWAEYFDFDPPTSNGEAIIKP